MRFREINVRNPVKSPMLSSVAHPMGYSRSRGVMTVISPSQTPEHGGSIGIRASFGSTRRWMDCSRFGRKDSYSRDGLFPVSYWFIGVSGFNLSIFLTFLGISCFKLSAQTHDPGRLNLTFLTVIPTHRRV